MRERTAELTAKQRDVLDAFRRLAAREPGRWWNGRRWIPYAANDVIGTYGFVAGECAADVDAADVRAAAHRLVELSLLRPVGRSRRGYLHLRLWVQPESAGVGVGSHSHII